MEKKDVVRNIIISANDFKFKEINGVEFETAVKYYIDQLESNQPEPAMPKIAEKIICMQENGLVVFKTGEFDIIIGSINPLDRKREFELAKYIIDKINGLLNKGE